MSEFTPLREAVDTLAGRAIPPDFDDLKRRATSRGRRRVGMVAAGGIAIILTVGIVGAALPGGERANQPAQQPSPTETASPTSTEWTPERFRAEGTPNVVIPETTSDLAVTEYLACDGTCNGEYSDRALEVSQDGQSALFEVRGLDVSFAPAWVKVFDEDSVLVQDAKTGNPEGPTRYRLLQADGTATELGVVDDPAPAVPGPAVFVIEPYSTWVRGGGRPGLYLVDDRAGTLRPLDVPQEIEWWGPNVDESLWGANECRITWQLPDGSFDQHDLDCLGKEAGDPGWNWRGFEDWLAPGRMAAVEWRNNGAPLALHASLDGGATWQRIEIPDTFPDDPSLGQIEFAIDEALGQLN